MSGFQAPGPVPWTYAAPYNPAASMGFDPTGFGAIAAPLMTGYLQQFAGPTNFLPHQFPGQAKADQFIMREYFNRSQQNLYRTNAAGDQRFANVLLGARGMVTNTPASDLNRGQALNMARTLNDPTVKGLVGMMIGPENLEQIMFGSAGDPMAMATAANRIGYYRPDALTGAKKMSARSLESFSRGMYATMYEPAGDVDKMVTEARAGDPAQTAALQKAARAESSRIVRDDEVSQRLIAQGEDRVNDLYKRYQPSGTATTVADKATALTKFDRAVNDAGVLSADEMTFGGLERKAKRAGLDNMHGFSASQAATVTENLFQKGLLPQSIGALSPAERVKVLAEQDMDDETLTRLAKEYGRHYLTEGGGRNSDAGAEFKAAGTDIVKQNAVIDRHTDDFKGQLRFNMAQLKGAVGTANPEDLLQLEGMDVVANQVDASKAGNAVKKHTEALAAIREIFGDSGNPNAPVPALLAALDHLSHGSMHQVGAGRVAGIMREMRGTAKEIGMGFDQLAGFSASVGAYGDTLGLSGPSKMNAVNEALTMVQSMRQSGALSIERYGAMSQEEALQQAGMLAARGEGSSNAKSVAALVRAYELDPSKYAGTELEAAVKSLKEGGDGNYEVKDASGNVVKTGNIYEQLGSGGFREASRIAATGGMTHQEFMTLHADSATMEYSQSGAAMRTMRQEYLERVGGNAFGGFLAQGLDKISDPDNKLDGRGAAAVRSRNVIATKFAEIALDTAHMDEKERVDHINKTIKDEFAAALIADAERQGITIDDAARAEATKQAEFAVRGILGDDPNRRDQTLQSRLAGFNTSSEQLTGRGAVATYQLFSKNQQAQFANAQTARKEEADRRYKLGLGLDSSPLGRLSDYLAETGMTGEAVTKENLIKELAGIIPDQKFRETLADQLMPQLNASRSAGSQHLVTTRHLDDLEQKTRSGDKKESAAAAEELRAIAARRDKRFEKADGLVTEQELTTKRAEALKGMDDAKLKAVYSRKFSDRTGRTNAEMIQELSASGVDLSKEAGLREQDLLKEGQYTVGQMRSAAETEVGKGRGKTEAEIAENRRRADREDRKAAGIIGATVEDQRRGTAAVLEDATGGTLKGEKLEQLVTASLEKGADGKHSDAFLKQLDTLGLSDDKKKEVLEYTARQREVKEAREKSGQPVGEQAEDKAGTKKTSETAAATDESFKLLATTAGELNKSFTELIAVIKAQRPAAGEQPGTQDSAAQVAQTKTAGTNVAATPPPAPTAAGKDGGTTQITGRLNIVGLDWAILTATMPQMQTNPGGITIAQT